MTDQTSPDSGARAWLWRVLTGIPRSHHSHGSAGQSSCSRARGLATPLHLASLHGKNVPPFAPLVPSLGGSWFSQNKHIMGLPENRGHGANPETGHFLLCSLFSSGDEGLAASKGHSLWCVSWPSSCPAGGWMPTSPGSRHEQISGESQRPLLTVPCSWWTIWAREPGKSALQCGIRPCEPSSPGLWVRHPHALGRGEPADTRRGGAGEPPALGSPPPPSPALSLHMHKPALLRRGVGGGRTERASGACCPLTLQLEDPIGLSKSRRAVQWNPELGRWAWFHLSPWALLLVTVHQNHQKQVSASQWGRQTEASVVFLWPLNTVGALKLLITLQKLI